MTRAVSLEAALIIVLESGKGGWNFKGGDWRADAGSYNGIQGPADGIFEAGIRERRTAFPAANYFSVTFEKFLMEI